MASSQFGTNEYPDLKYLNQFIAKELRTRLTSIDESLSMTTRSALNHLLDKGYTARAQANILYDSHKVVGSGDLVTILFRLGDGTGVCAPDAPTLKNIPDKWMPRQKTGHAEICIPIGTAYGDCWLPGITSLQAVTLEGKALVKYKELTTPLPRFKDLLEASPRAATSPPCDFTFDSTARPAYGNPHAIIWNPQAYETAGITPRDPFFQVATFLSFPQVDRYLDIFRERSKER